MYQQNYWTFKFRVMKRKGYKLESPIVSHGNFLKTIE